MLNSLHSSFYIYNYPFNLSSATAKCDFTLSFFLWDRKQGGPDEEEQSQWTRAADHCLGEPLPGHGLGGCQAREAPESIYLPGNHSICCSGAAHPCGSHTPIQFQKNFWELTELPNAILTGAFITGWILSQFKKLATYYCDHFIEEHFDSENYGKSISPEASRGLGWGKLCSEKVTYQPGILNMLQARVLSSQTSTAPGTMLRTFHWSSLSLCKSPSSPAVAVSSEAICFLRKGNTLLWWEVDATH